MFYYILLFFFYLRRIFFEVIFKLEVVQNFEIFERNTLPSAAGSALGKTLSLCRVPRLGTRQSFELCRVPAVRHSAKPPSTVAPTWQFCRVPLALGNLFVECPKIGTRQSPLCCQGLCRVLHSAKTSPSVTLGKDFAECISSAFAECIRHSAKPLNPVVI